MIEQVRMPVGKVIFQLKTGDNYTAVDENGESYRVILAPTKLQLEAARHLVNLNEAVNRLTNLALQLQLENDKLLAELIEQRSKCDQTKI